KKGGTLRVGIAGGSPSDNFDAALVNGPSPTTRMQVFYETPIWLDGKFKLHNWLAESLEPNATANRWTMRLRRGLEFHNGKTVTADDVLFSLRRIMNPKIGATASAQLGALDLKKTRKVDARTVEFALKQPYSFFDQVLSDIVYIVPTGYDPKKPVSTGPWKMVSYTPGRQAELVPFENYWGKKPLVDELLVVELPDDNARVNALLTGQVDVINSVPFSQAATLGKNSAIKLVSSPTGAYNPITMRVDQAPFDDVRVRQAIRLCMDRKQAVATALFGQGTPGNDTFGKFDPSYSNAFKREIDIDRATSLLKAAKQQNLKLELTTTPLGAGIVEACQLLAQNAKKAGIDITVKKTDIGTFFGGYGKWPFAVDYWVGLPFLVLSSLNEGPDATIVNPAHFSDPEYNKLFNQAAATLDLKKRTEIVHQMQKIQFERGGNLIWSYQNTLDAYSTKVAGYDPVDRTGWGLGRCRLDRLYFT
ncbi:MAG: ABC transporter substrate-binding protein, partial [Actinobacteria bacterium]|nr:ABC transporter substrate-binding protein [Actinomycetota bacterium]